MLSIVASAKLRVISDDKNSTCLREVSSMAGTSQLVYDWYGDVREITIADKPVMETLYRILAMSGETVVVGNTHQMLCRQYSKARYELVPIKKLASIKRFFVKLPQRKIQMDNSIPFETLEMDSKSIYLEPKPAQLGLASETAATAGLSVRRHKTESKIYLDVNRPPCFATKLINGNFDKNLTETLESLCASAVIMPHGPFNDQYIEKTKKTALIFEGATLYNDVLVVGVSHVENTLPVYHINRDDSTPVELPWFCT